MVAETETIGREFPVFDGLLILDFPDEGGRQARHLFAVGLDASEDWQPQHGEGEVSEGMMLWYMGGSVKRFSWMFCRQELSWGTWVEISMKFLW